MLSHLVSFANTVKARASRDETGATAVEYGIMVALIAVVIIVAVTFLGGTISDMFQQASCEIGGGTYSAGVEADAGDSSCTPPTP